MPLKIKRPSINKKLAVLAITHFLNDLHGTFLATFIPLIVGRLGISYAQAGLLKSLSGVIHMVVQPMAGYASDLFSRPYAIIIGPILTAIGASMLPLAPTYGTALIFVGLWGFGSAVYHPLGYGSVGYVGNPDKLAFFIAIFSVGGILGSTLSPLYAILLLKTFGTGLLLPVAALVPVIAGAWLVIRFVPTLRAEGSVERPSPRGFFRSFRNTFKVIFPIWIVCVCRDTAAEGIRFFLPLLIASRGGSIINIGTVLFWISTAGTISPMLGGRLADRFGTRKVIEIAMAIAPFFLVPAALTSGIPSIILYMAGDALLHAILPVTGAAALKMVPGARSTAASMVTGLSFGLAGLLIAPIGAMADSFGLTWVLVFVGILPILPMPIFWTMWKEQKQGDRHQDTEKP
ncbi:MAG: MFS transporter [Thermovirgaceae bacterium]|nr:MFS transporter [Thermovirgaceae bacterium]